MTLNYNLLPQTKYTKWYIDLMESRKFQEKEKFKTEKHHIFPVSIFEKNSFVVNLTHREHYIAHLLLWKMYKNEHFEKYFKMVYAFKSLSELHNKINKRTIKINSKLYSILREEVSIMNSVKMKQRWKDQDFREKLTKHNQEYWSDEENRKQQSEKRKQHLSVKENYDKLVEVNKELTSKESWRKKRSENQKRLSQDKEYTKMRIDAMNTPESKAKSLKNQRKTIDAMTPEERKVKFGREKTTQQIQMHAAKIKGRKKIVNINTKETKVVCLDDIQNYLDLGWQLWNDVSVETKHKLFGKRTAWNKGLSKQI